MTVKHGGGGGLFHRDLESSSSLLAETLTSLNSISPSQLLYFLFQLSLPTSVTSSKWSHVTDSIYGEKLLSYRKEGTSVIHCNVSGTWRHRKDKYHKSRLFKIVGWDLHIQVCFLFSCILSSKTLLLTCLWHVLVPLCNNQKKQTIARWNLHYPVWKQNISNTFVANCVSRADCISSVDHNFIFIIGLTHIRYIYIIVF